MNDPPKHVRGVQGAYPQRNVSPLENNGVAGASNGKGKGNSTGEKPPPSSPCDDDEIHVNSDLLAAWMQRLQFLTVVTAFLASMDGELFSLTALNTQIGISISPTARELVYSCLAGALIFHICATILAYVASFALIRYRIIDVSESEEGKSEEGIKVGSILSPRLGATQPEQRPSRRIILEAVHPLQWLITCLQGPDGLRFLAVTPSSRPPPPPPFSLVTRCYYTTLCLTAVGFTLALTGILAYVWAGLVMPVGIFATICLGVGISAGVWAIAI